MPLPPGPRLLLASASQCVVPLILTYLVLFLVSHIELSILPIPSSILVLLSLLAKPFSFACQVQLRPFVYRYNAKKNRASAAPLVPGTALQVGRKAVASLTSGYPGDVFHVWMLQHGWIYQLPDPTKLQFFTFEPEHVKIISKTRFDHFEKGPILGEMLESLLGSGILNVDGDLWKLHRSLARPFFNKERVNNFEIFEKNVSQAIRLVKRRIREGSSLDFQDLAARFTLQSVTEFLLGADIESPSGDLPHPPSLRKQRSIPEEAVKAAGKGFSMNKFTEDIESAFEFLNKRTPFGSLWPLVTGEFWEDKIAPLRATLDSLVDPILEASFEEIAERKVLGGKTSTDGERAREYRSLLSYLATQTEDRKLIKDEIYNLLVAGRNTTTSFLTSSLYMICEHPEVERRLRAEITKIVGNERHPTAEDMREMKYTRAFLNEVLRLYPPTPLNGRQCVKDIVFPPTPRTPATYIPKGSMCSWSTIHMHRATELWGPDALEFDPDRFMDERLHKYLTPTPFIFHPFHGGPRSCLGQELAYNEVTYFLIRFMQMFENFSLDMKENVPPPESWKTYPGLQATERLSLRAKVTIYIEGGMWVNLKERVHDSPNADEAEA